VKKTRALLYIQEDDRRNDGLRKQFKTVVELLNDSITTFILASKEHLETMHTNEHTEKKKPFKSNSTKQLMLVCWS